MIAGTVLEKILLAIIDEVGLPTLVQYLVANNSAAQVQAILTGEYKAAQAAADAEAKAVLKP